MMLWEEEIPKVAVRKISWMKSHFMTVANLSLLIFRRNVDWLESEKWFGCDVDEL
jgi:hypothetical protein